MVEKTWCAVQCNIYSEAAPKNQRLRMIDSDATATDKLHGKRLKWYSLGECAQSALEGLGLHIQTLHKRQRNVQTQARVLIISAVGSDGRGSELNIDTICRNAPLENQLINWRRPLASLYSRTEYQY